MASQVNTPDILADVMPMHDSRYYTSLEFIDTIPCSPDNISLLHINAMSLNTNFEYLKKVFCTL